MLKQVFYIIIIIILRTSQIEVAHAVYKFRLGTLFIIEYFINLRAWMNAFLITPKSA